VGEDGLKKTLAGPWEHSAANGNDEALCSGPKQRGDVVANPAQMAEVNVPICLRGSADAKHCHIRRIESLFIENPRTQPAFGNVSLDKGIQPGLKERRSRSSDCLNLIEIAVYPEYAVANLGKARGAYTADVSKANHNYVLFAFHAVRPGLI
jgi:hypothetical protein